jgi:chromosome segregation ATPase
MRILVFMLAASSLMTISVAAQDESPSLGDVARQSRQQKQKAAQPRTKTSAAQTSKPAHVITNEELPEHATTLSTPRNDTDASATSTTAATTGTRDEQGQQLKDQIQSQKQAIAALQQQIKEIGDSIQYAGGNCVSNCVQWNERQKQTQDQVESMKAQLADQQKKLEEMQEAARKQGFGSSIYEP